VSRNPKSSQSKSAARARRPQRQASETLHFEDAELVRAVAGPGHENFAVVERELGVRLEAPGGGQVVVTGPEARGRTDARRVLNALYSRAEQKLQIDPAAVRAACVMDDADAGEEVDSIIRVPRGTSFAARTNGQRDYVRMLKDDRSYDMVFGVGPAGTGKTLLAVAYGASRLALGEVERLSSPARRSRPASGWASCPAIWPRRSTLICCRSGTPCATRWASACPTRCARRAAWRSLRWPSCAGGP
jgi:phosphate starvation-inducible protein PhoH